MATQTALIIPADSNAPVREVTYQDRDSLKTMQEAVGGWIVPCPGLKMDAYANDNGFAERLPFNRRISVAIRDTYPSGILGDVIIPKLTPTKRAKLEKMGLL